ncbi:transposase [Brumimicrobium oceani]|uniref:transposase n=1 Tax=Brumimicrobium oceani TaxID=2100725 RepID=UPI0013049B4A|nr:transposase [Brumimicrobium oceani]
MKDYLGNYIHPVRNIYQFSKRVNYLTISNGASRVAISNQRILKHTDGKVIFGYKDYKNAGLRKTMSLPEEEFIRRFLQHILPSGFRKIRYFGFMSLRFLKENLDKCVEILNKAVFLPMLEGLNALEVVSFTLNKDMTACKKGRMRAKHKIIASPT